MGFSIYDIPEPSTPTTQEILATLTSQQKLDILDGFAKNTSPVQLKHQAFIPLAVIRYLYKKIDEVEEKSRKIMRGELLITPAVYDEEGIETSPAVYNIPAVDRTDLITQLGNEFEADLTAGQLGAAIDKMVLYSKSTEDGDWTFYSENVIL